MSNRPLSIPHLVFGLIFLGATVLWVIGASTEADASDLAVLAPAVLIGAGVIGLAGIVVNARRHDVPIEAALDPHGRAYDDPAAAEPTQEEVQ
jgi:hypothetical protein